jgi:Ras family protein
MDASFGSNHAIAPADSAGGSPVLLRTPIERPAAVCEVNEDAFMEAATTRYYLQESDDADEPCCWWLRSKIHCIHRKSANPLSEDLLETPLSEAAPTPPSTTVCCGFLCCERDRSEPERHTLPRLSSTLLGLGRQTPNGTNRMSSPASPRVRSASNHTETISANGTPQRLRMGDSRAGGIEVVRKVVMLGARNSGKSSVVHRFADKRFGAAYDPTIESTVRAKIIIRGVTFMCDLLDTAGQDEYSNFSRQATVGVHGYCMVFSITSMQSFIAIQKIHERITELVGSYTVPIVLVGTKSDDEIHREVPSAAGDALAESWGASYVECSAKSDYGIDDVFVTLLFEIERESGLLAFDDSEDSDEAAKRNNRCTIS